MQRNIPLPEDLQAGLTAAIRTKLANVIRHTNRKSIDKTHTDWARIGNVIYFNGEPAFQPSDDRRDQAAVKHVIDENLSNKVPPAMIDYVTGFSHQDGFLKLSESYIINILNSKGMSRPKKLAPSPYDRFDFIVNDDGSITCIEQFGLMSYINHARGPEIISSDTGRPLLIGIATSRISLVDNKIQHDFISNEILITDKKAIELAACFNAQADGNIQYLSAEPIENIQKGLAAARSSDTRIPMPQHVETPPISTVSKRVLQGILIGFAVAVVITAAALLIASTGGAGSGIVLGFIGFAVLKFGIAGSIAGLFGGLLALTAGIGATIGAIVGAQEDQRNALEMTEENRLLLDPEQASAPEDEAPPTAEIPSTTQTLATTLQGQAFDDTRFDSLATQQFYNKWRVIIEDDQEELRDQWNTLINELPNDLLPDRENIQKLAYRINQLSAPERLVTPENIVTILFDYHVMYQARHNTVIDLQKLIKKLTGFSEKERDAMALDLQERINKQEKDLVRNIGKDPQTVMKENVVQTARMLSQGQRSPDSLFSKLPTDVAAKIAAKTDDNLKPAEAETIAKKNLGRPIPPTKK